MLINAIEIINMISLREYKFELKERRKIKEEKMRHLRKSCTEGSAKIEKLEAKTEEQFQIVSFDLYPYDLEQLSP